MRIMWADNHNANLRFTNIFDIIQNMKYDQNTISLGDGIKEMRPVAFTTMLKPAGSTCNLNCSYCYYLDKALQYGGKQCVMNEELLEDYIRQYIQGNAVDTVTFCWHGGEPLLLGTDYYRKAVKLQKKYAAGKKILNTIQTNGTLLNDEWCRFFKEKNFLVGISLDGPKDVHDAFRINSRQQPTWDKVMEGVNLLKRYGVEFNTLSVVNSLCEGRGKEIYNFFKSIGSHYMQFLPAVEHVVENKQNADINAWKRRDWLIVSPETEGAVLAPWSISAKAYGQFLCDIFDEWIKSDVGTYYVQMFDATLAQYCGVQPGVCSMCETCGDCLVVEHNGDVYNCDHFVYPEYRLGNIREKTLGEIYADSKRLQFGLNKRNTLPAECQRCKYYFCCRGECPKHRFDKGKDGQPKNSLCEGLYAYFDHVAPYMETMRKLIAGHQAPALVMAMVPQNHEK